MGRMTARMARINMLFYILFIPAVILFILFIARS